MEWKKEVESISEELIIHTQKLLQIKSVLDETTIAEGAPFGRGIREAYEWMLALAKKDGFLVHDVDGYAGHIEYGDGDEIVGVLCHLDVVPEGEGWTSPPYNAEIRNGNIYARGAIDDKGPTMAAYFALKLVKQLDLPLTKRVRLILGNDEESQWRCVEHYFKHEEMPSLGFAPDADFPIINAEKGICDFEIISGTEVNRVVKEFTSGERLNMVPEKAIAILTGVDIQELEHYFIDFVNDQRVKGEIKRDNNEIVIHLQGKSAHGMEPDKGVNSGLLLAHFIYKYVPNLTEKEKEFFSMLEEHFYLSSRGEKLGISFRDEKKGDVTVNVGIISLSSEAGKIGVNLRYPEGVNFTNLYNTLEKKIVKKEGKISIRTHIEPHAVEEHHPLVQTLAKVYEEQTGEQAELLAIGGGTYARSLNAGVAFGPMFPGQVDVAHQADEYISIDNLKKATALYAQAIYELAK